MTPPLCKHSILLHNLIAQQIQCWKLFWENVDNKNCKSQFDTKCIPLITNNINICKGSRPLIKVVCPPSPPVCTVICTCTLVYTHF